MGHSRVPDHEGWLVAEVASAEDNRLIEVHVAPNFDELDHLSYIGGSEECPCGPTLRQSEDAVPVVVHNVVFYQ